MDRAWFADQARDRGLVVDEHGAWWGDPCGGDAVLVGGRPDLAPELAGIALDAIDTLRAGRPRPHRPVGLMTGTGPPPDRLGRAACFVDLRLDPRGRLEAPVSVVGGVWPRGRWLLDFTGPGYDAGSALSDRRDPTLTFAYAVLAANKEARLRGGYATIGRAELEPNDADTVPFRVRAWLDARAASPTALAELAEAVRGRAADRAARDGTAVTVIREAYTPPVLFDPDLTERIRGAVANGLRTDCPTLTTPASHPGGPLPTAMVVIGDQAAGVRAVAALLAALSEKG